MGTGVSISEHTVADPAYGMYRPDLKIAFVSDFHAGPTTDPRVIDAAIRAVRDAAPHIVLMGGDFVGFDAEAVDYLLPSLDDLAEEVPTYAVLGNHDWVTNAEYVARQLQSIGVHLVTNRNVQLAPPYDHVWICGLDDHWCGWPDAASAFDGAAGIRIVLMHAPSGILDIGTHRFHLAICGHTHGGQIALPGGRPILLPNGALTRRYPGGRYRLPEGGTLIVSRGVGCSLLPFRYQAEPEVVICTLSGAPTAVNDMKHPGEIGDGHTRL